MSPQRTAWHFYFTILLRNRRPLWIDVRDEVPLSEERPRVDYLFLRKVQEPAPGDTGQTLRRLWPLIPQAAIAEFKSVTRPYRARGLDRLFMYLHAYWIDAADLKQRQDLVGVLIVANRTPTLNADVAAMGLKFRDLRDGYWEIKKGLFRVYVVELDRVGVQEDDGVLGSFGHNEVRTRAAGQFWTEQVGTKEAGMEAQNLEGYEEVIARFLATLPIEQRLAGLSEDQIMAGMSREKLVAGLAPEQRLAGLAPEQRLAGLAPEQRLAGLAPKERLAGLSPEQVVLSLPDDVLRGLSDSYLATLSDPVRETIRQRIGR